MRKKALILVSMLLCSLVFSACMADDKEGYLAPNNLMEGASPSTSALSLTIYDGVEAKQYHMFDSSHVRSILGALDEVPVKEAQDFQTENISYPIYGLEIGDTEGWTISACWSNGYWITDKGQVFHFDYDFSKLAQADAWQFSNSYESINVVPCAYWLCQASGQWNTKLMTVAEEATAPEGIVATLADWGEEYVKVVITNNSAESWTYGESFSLQVEYDGVWYSVPTTPGNWGFNSIGYELMPGGEKEQTYWLGVYGNLPKGRYRLVAYGLTVEQTS